MAITILYKQKEMHSISKILQKDKLHSRVQLGWKNLYKN